MNKKRVLRNLIIILSPLLFGILISIFTDSKSYKIMNKPFLSPPSILFPIAWTILYLLMGISFYLVSKDEINYEYLKPFVTQLIINYIWPILFFNLKLYVISALWIILLIYNVIKMIKIFNNKNKKSALLQIPYLIWLFFALYLNIGVAILN